MMSAKCLTAGSPEKSKPRSAALTGFCRVSPPAVSRCVQRTLSHELLRWGPAASCTLVCRPVTYSLQPLGEGRHFPPRRLEGLRTKCGLALSTAEHCGRLSPNVTPPSWDLVRWHPNALCLDFIILNVIKHFPATFTGSL